MENLDWIPLAIAAAAGAAGAGVVWLLARRADPLRAQIAALDRELQEERERGAALRLELQRELDEERERGSAYRDAVAKHFGQTSELFRDLTHQYTALYAHLAEGARDLAADRLPSLAGRFGAPVLEPGAPGGPAPEGAASEEDPDEPLPEMEFRRRPGSPM